MSIIYNLYNYIRAFNNYSMLLAVAIIGITMMIGITVCDHVMTIQGFNATLNSTILVGQP